jgi:hypothetical protein
LAFDRFFGCGFVSVSGLCAVEHGDRFVGFETLLARDSAQRFQIGEVARTKGGVLVVFDSFARP